MYSDDVDISLKLASEERGRRAEKELLILAELFQLCASDQMAFSTEALEGASFILKRASRVLGELTVGLAAERQAQEEPSEAKQKQSDSVSRDMKFGQKNQKSKKSEPTKK